MAQFIDREPPARVEGSSVAVALSAQQSGISEDKQRFTKHGSHQHWRAVETLVRFHLPRPFCSRHWKASLHHKHASQCLVCLVSCRIITTFTFFNKLSDFTAVLLRGILYV